MPARVILTPPPFIKVRLQSGITICSHSVRMEAIYAGVLEGLPNDHNNQMLIGRHATELKELWGTVPIYLIPSDIQRSTTRSGRKTAILPPAQISALFTKHNPNDVFEPSSQLVLVWHQDKAPPLMSPEVKSQIQQLDWDKTAAIIEE